MSILFGCSKEPSAPQEEINTINFFCGMEQAQTKANSVFASGNTAIIYAYASGGISNLSMEETIAKFVTVVKNFIS